MLDRRRTERENTDTWKNVKMVRRHSLPPHALKRQNSRFKIGAGVAAAEDAQEEGFPVVYRREGRGDPY